MRKGIPILTCLLVLATAVAASAAEGEVDPSFGEAGLVHLNALAHERFPGLWNDETRVADGSDGTITALSVLAGCEEPCRRVLVFTRYRRNGSLDARFGEDGVVAVTLAGDFGWDVSVDFDVDSHGRAVVAYRADDGAHVLRLARNGHRDRDFADDGTATIGGAPAHSSVGLTVSPAGLIFVWGSSTVNGSAPLSDARLLVARLRPDGSPDRRFGSSGVREVLLRNREAPEAVAVLGNGGLVLGGIRCCRGLNLPYLVRLGRKGAIDRRFGRSLGLGRLRGVSWFGLGGLLPRPDGTIDVVGEAHRKRGPRWGEGGFVVRVRADGARAIGFGRDGVKLLKRSVDAAALDRRGGLVAVSRAFFRNGLSSFRLLPDGRLDRSFGDDGIVSMSAGSGGEGLLRVFLVGHPVIFNERIFECRSGCPPDPVLIGLRGGGRR